MGSLGSLGSLLEFFADIEISWAYKKKITIFWDFKKKI